MGCDGLGPSSASVWDGAPLEFLEEGPKQDDLEQVRRLEAFLAALAEHAAEGWPASAARLLPVLQRQQSHLKKTVRPLLNGSICCRRSTGSIRAALAGQPSAACSARSARHASRPYPGRCATRTSPAEMWSCTQFLATGEKVPTSKHLGEATCMLNNCHTK